MNSIIRSFEELKIADQTGDLLPDGKIKRKVKIGILACGYFEYWRMYPDSLEHAVKSDLSLMIQQIEQWNYPVVYPGMVDTLESADQAGKVFRRDDIDVLLVIAGTYLPDFISLHAINYVKKAPVLFVSFQGENDVNPHGNYESSLRNSGLIAIAQITGTFKKMRRPYEVVVGSLKDEDLYAKIKSFIQAVQAIQDVSESNIGIIGHVFRGMYDLELSKTFLKSTFDVNVINIQSTHLMDEWKDISPVRISQETKMLVERFKTRGIEQDDIYRAIQLALAIENLADRFKLDALCFLDQHFVQRQTQSTARMGASLLMERSDRAATCEGDLGGLVMMMMMRSISGHAALMGEWGEYDLSRNACLVLGHGIGTPDLASSDEAITLTRTPEEWGFSGAGLNYEFIMKPGPVTIGHFIETTDGYRMLISPCESISYPTLKYDELHAMLRVDKPIRDYLEAIMKSGVTHHCIVGLGDMSVTLGYIAKMLNIETLFIK